MDPVEPKYYKKMNDIARLLDDALNQGVKPKVTGFVLLMFDFGDDKRMNYISNAQREDMLSALKELVARFEGRAVDEAGHA